MISKLESHLNNFLEYFPETSTQSPSDVKSLGSFRRLLEYDISDLSNSSITNHKGRLYRLATFADISKIQIRFHGLEELTKKYEMLFGCSWNLEDDFPREKEFFDLLNMIQSQSNVSSRKYDIQLVE